MFTCEWIYLRCTLKGATIKKIILILCLRFKLLAYESYLESYDSISYLKFRVANNIKATKNFHSVSIIFGENVRDEGGISLELIYNASKITISEMKNEYLQLLNSETVANIKSLIDNNQTTELTEKLKCY